MGITYITLLLTVTSSSVAGLATDVRLVHNNVPGLMPYEGAVEVLVDEKWGPLLRHGVDEITAKTICKILGYGFQGFPVQRFSYAGVPVLTELKCDGNETSISQCKQVPSSYMSEFYDAPGIHCFDHVPTDVRLIPDDNGPPNSGSVQVKMDGRWGLLCDYNSWFGIRTAPTIDHVLCKSLGYETNIPGARRGSSHGVELSWIDMDMTTCTGLETSFMQCDFKPLTINQPGCNAVRGVTCITQLYGYCTSDTICAGIPNTACMYNTCVCKQYYRYNDGTCIPDNK